MKRREAVLVLLALGFAPLTGSAQKTVAMPRLGVLIGLANSPRGQEHLTGLREGLQQVGWIEGQNIQIDLRWGDGKAAVMRAQAEALVSGKPDLIAVSTATALREVQRAAGKIPIVFWGASDPVGNKFVQNMAHPEANTTGFSLFEYEMGGKWLQLLKEAAPRLKRILVLMSAVNPNWPGWLRAIEPIAPSLGLELVRPNVTDVAQIELAISAFAREANGGVLVLPDPFLATHQELLSRLITKLRLPSISGVSDYVHSGGLIAYGIDQNDLARRAGIYVSRILKGEKPGDLPVQSPTKFELIINLKTAKALGLKISQSLLLRANEVIE